MRRQPPDESKTQRRASQLTTDIPDGPYRTPGPDFLNIAAEWVARAIEDMEPERVAIPLGFPGHPDHVLTREAGNRAVPSRRPMDTYYHADLPYFVGHDVDEMAAGFGGTVSPLPEPSEASTEYKFGHSTSTRPRCNCLDSPPSISHSLSGCTE
jgi:hypothetical protein